MFILILVFVSDSFLLSDYESRNVINGTLIVGERNVRNGVIMIDPFVDSNTLTTSAIYTYDNQSSSIVVTGNLFPPDTFVKCSVGCHSSLVNFSDFCNRVYPPRCIEMRSKHLVTFNLTSGAWNLNLSKTSENTFFTTYDIVY